MKILSVTVDKLPAGCGECPLGVDIGGDSPDYICAALPEETKHFAGCCYLPDLNFRRHDCPLRETFPYSRPWFDYRVAAQTADRAKKMEEAEKRGACIVEETEAPNDIP